MNAVTEQTPPQSGLIAVSETTPPLIAPTDAEVDLEILRSVPKQFAIEDEKSANWLVKKIAASRQYAINVKKWAELELRRAEREEQCLMFMFGRQMERWASEEIAKLNGKRKSLNLPAGTVGFRTVGPRLVIDNERTVLLWAKLNCPTAIAVVEKLSKSVLDEQMEKTGVVPEEGIHIEPQRERFYVK